MYLHIRPCQLTVSFVSIFLVEIMKVPETFKIIDISDNALMSFYASMIFKVSNSFNVLINIYWAPVPC